MHRTSPGVERAVTGARAWADRLHSDAVRLGHFVLALLDEEEGRPAVLLEHVGANVSAVRETLSATETPVAPPVGVLFNAARDWSLAYRHDPEFLTDALLLAVLRADRGFGATAEAMGFGVGALERALGVEPTPGPPSLQGGGLGGWVSPPSRSLQSAARATRRPSAPAG